MLVHATPRARGGPGFTLVEVCWTIAIAAVIAAVSVVSLHRWASAERMRATTSAIEAVLRETQQRAITEGRTLCLNFDLTAQTYSMLRGACGTTGQVRIEGPVRPEAGVVVHEALFPTAGGGTATGVTMYPRGTASPGTLRISRSDSDHVSVLTVDGLTGRVSRA